MYILRDVHGASVPVVAGLMTGEEVGDSAVINSFIIIDKNIVVNVHNAEQINHNSYPVPSKPI